jgi:hypothetical protein
MGYGVDGAADESARRDGAAAACSLLMGIFIFATNTVAKRVLQGHPRNTSLAIPGVPRGSLAMKEKWKGCEILEGGEEEKADAYAEEPVFDMPATVDMYDGDEDREDREADLLPPISVTRASCRCADSSVNLGRGRGMPSRTSSTASRSCMSRCLSRFCNN